MIPEMSRPLPLDRVGEGTLFVVQAAEAELAPLAARMGLQAVQFLTCSFDLQREGRKKTVVQAHGRLLARVVQSCVVSLEPFETDIAEDFVVRFVPEGSESDELDLDAVDEIPYTGALLDLGEAAAEQLALALDPFPRKPGAELPQAEGGNADGGAFAALGRLRQRG